ncbi:MAG: lysophospholipid acyltransferase family protein [Prevotella sp.]|nr:lysophospholipid acyltransferase family protein [Prevotella sp.]
MSKILYPIVYGFCYLISLLPLRVLYCISDVLYLLLYKLIGYRRRVVRNNLSTSFPEKDEKERRTIEKKFYHFFCDYIIETIKLLSIRRKTLLKHMEYRNMEEMERCFDEGQSVCALLGHYCNWEFLTTVNVGWKRYPEAKVGLVYHPLSSKVVDRLIIATRQHTGGVAVPKQEVLRYMIRYKQQGLHSLFGLISDQSPKWENIHLWLPFLNHETPVFTGAERLIRKMNNAVFYAEMSRPKRGKYVVNFQLMTREPGTLEENELTRMFFTRLEETIRQTPHLYLWSHDRWKRTREEFERRFTVDAHGHVTKKDKSN